jgi:hypothetical protein
MRVRKPNAAETLAVTALVLASSGSAVAASRYLITSPSQIKPSVLRSIANASRGETSEPTSAWAISQPGLPLISARAECPAGYSIVSGGYEADLPGAWKIIYSKRFTEGWVARAYSPEMQSQTQAKLRTTAYCRSGG